MYRLLFIDDDAEVLSIHEKHFTSRGYEVAVATSAAAGLALLARQAFDCIVLDVMMPGQDGFEACMAIREKTQAPVLFLTGRLDEEDKVRGLMTGGDDYIAKPCSLMELEARVAANIRRSVKSADDTAKALRLSIPPLELDVAAHQALCNGESLQLTGREYDTLYLLATNAGQPVTYEQIAQQMWGTYQEDDRRSVMVSVSRLRKKMEAYPELVGMIETVWSKGYTLVSRQRHIPEK